MAISTSEIRAAGYTYLLQKYQLSTIPNWHRSFVSNSSNINHHTAAVEGQTETIFPASYWPGDDDGDHLEFAIKYDGINLECLTAILNAVSDKELTAWISSKPIGKYVRKIWFFYEYLLGKILPIADLSQGNYIELLDSEEYYTIEKGQRNKRQRIIQNLLGGRSFCPMVRRSQKLREMETIDITERCKNIVHDYPPEILKRALTYLYKKETKSSFQIENVKPTESRTEKYIGLLQIAELQDYCTKPSLVDLQNRIVDPRFQESDYRTFQNYVGQSVSLQRQIVYFISPKPENIEGLMNGLLECHQIMKAGGIPTVIHAAVISYGFVFLHPFGDGNGRIHRFLIHNIMHIRNAIPKGFMFPVSAAMLKNPTLYDQSLEAFSRPLMQLFDYEMDAAEQIRVQGESVQFYRHIDMTRQAESLFDFVMLTIDHELVEELDFLASYDLTKRAMQEIVDLPDNLIDLFIKFYLQNNGHLSARKRLSRFAFLSDTEVEQLEKAVKEGYQATF